MFSRRFRHRQCTASIEFAIVCPLLLAIVAGLSDFPLAFWRHSLIETGVANGAAYAFQQMQTDLTQSQTVSTSAIQAVVLDSIDLPNVSVTVTPPALECVTINNATTPATASLTPATAGSTCSDGSLPGTYISITATYDYVPLMPFYSEMTNTTITETANVRAY